ncbi:MAG: endonuclease domain-containing protein [Pseudomonadota bacterium]
MIKTDRADRAARRLRRDPTRAEQHLWKLLRSIEGAHFRRQAPFGSYVVDFVCHRSRLVVEVDGAVHAQEEVRAKDEVRDAWLVGRGYTVLRISNEEALFDSVTALERIIAALGVDTPTPNPSPQGGGESY